MDYIIYLFLRWYTFFFRIIPFSVLYFISDIVFFLMYYFIRYRKKTVLKNILNSFPEKTENERNLIAKKFYKHLCDLALESLKGFTASKEVMGQRYKVLNPEFADRYFREGRDAMLLASHYCNWEWGAVACDMQFEYTLGFLYKPLTNKYAEEYSLKKRSRFGGDFVGIAETGKYFLRKKPQPVLYVMPADQSPSNSHLAYWMQFLNQETGFIHGPEKFAKKLNLPVLFMDIRKKKRGYYEITIKEITDKPKELPEGMLAKKYAQIMEDIIREKPEDWLWSHKRWKRQKPADALTVN